MIPGNCRLVSIYWYFSLIRKNITITRAHCKLILFFWPNSIIIIRIYPTSIIICIPASSFYDFYPSPPIISFLATISLSLATISFLCSVLSLALCLYQTALSASPSLFFSLSRHFSLWVSNSDMMCGVWLSALSAIPRTLVIINSDIVIYCLLWWYLNIEAISTVYIYTG